MITIALLTLCATSCRAAEAPPVRDDLYQCEGCEGVYERDVDTLGWRTVMAGLGEPGERMILRGVAFQADGKTPARDIIIYVYHTNADGLYANGSNETEWSRRHGRLRGWIKTGVDGRYEFSTIKPAPYPERTMPAHIHPTILEPGRPPYWIDNIVFKGEFGVTPAYREATENRGGDGVTQLTREDGVWVADRDIVLERHSD